MSARESTSDQDPLGKLYQQLERLRGNGPHDRATGAAIQDIEQSIGEIIRQREAAQRSRDDDRGR